MNSDEKKDLMQTTRQIWNIKGRLIGAVSVCILIVVGIFYYLNANDVKQVSFFKQADFNDLDSVNSWQSFSEKLHISKNAKIEGFELILDKHSNIYSAEFDVIDKSDAEFIIYHYRNCFSCELAEENQVQMSKSTADDWVQYPELIRAETFFSSLDTLKQASFFENNGFNYRMIHSSGLLESIGLTGDYYVLANNRVKKIENPIYQGFNMQVMGNHLPANFGTDEKTRTVFFAKKN